MLLISFGQIVELHRNEDIIENLVTRLNKKNDGGK